METCFYAKYPVLAGHFENDGILFAEKAIDYNLNEELSQRHSLGLYPGPIGTSEVFLNHQSGFKGAVIIGLGKPEDLTGPQLAKSVAQGVSNYLLNLSKIMSEEMIWLAERGGNWYLHR
jgi:hypothetical protein